MDCWVSKQCKKGDCNEVGSVGFKIWTDPDPGFQNFVEAGAGYGRKRFEIPSKLNFSFSMYRPE